MWYVAKGTAIEQLLCRALEMGGNQDQFIVKATLLLKGCPAPNCPGHSGGHSKGDLPGHCLTWWRETGWRLMGWKGARATACSADVKKKINNFRKVFNLRRKNVQEKVAESQTQESQNCQSQPENLNSQECMELHRQGALWHCQFCSYRGSFSFHLDFIEILPS